MHISSVIKISFCCISFSGHQNKFCACFDILDMCKNCSDMSWHRLNWNQSIPNCPKNLNSDGLVVREMGPWPECIFRSLLQFLVISFCHCIWYAVCILWVRLSGTMRCLYVYVYVCKRGSISDFLDVCLTFYDAYGIILNTDKMLCLINRVYFLLEFFLKTQSKINWQWLR